MGQYKVLHNLAIFWILYLALKKKSFLDLDLNAVYSNISDDVGCDSIGYCFLEDARNETFMVTYWNSLREAILNSFTLSLEFLRTPVPAQIPEGWEPDWNHDHLTFWYIEYCCLSTLIPMLITVGAEMSCHETELICIHLRNVSGRRRDLYYLSNRLVLMTQYNKMSSITGWETMMPYILNAYTSNLLLQRLIIADSFANLVVSLIYKDKPQVLHLHHIHLFLDMTEPFETSRFSQILLKFRKRALHIPMGFQCWRHFSIALRCKFCPKFAVFYLF